MNAFLLRYRLVLSVRFLATGVISALLGMFLFLVCLLFVATFIDSLESVEAQCMLLSLVVCCVCFVVSWRVGRLRYALASRWACMLAYAVVWGVLLKQVADFAVAVWAPVAYFLLFGFLFCFLGGSMGDTVRRRRENDRMRAEADELAREVFEEEPSP